MHADTVSARVRNVAQGCKFNFYSDISASAIHEFLADCRRGGLPKWVKRPDGRSLNTRKMSNQTSNFYLAAVKQFCTWMVQDRRATQSPVNHLDGVNVALDPRHDRRNLAADELSRLLNATMAGKRHHWLSGRSRAMLYRVAMETGLRRNELAYAVAGQGSFLAGPTGDRRRAGRHKKPRAGDTADPPRDGRRAATVHRSR